MTVNRRPALMGGVLALVLAAAGAGSAQAAFPGANGAIAFDSDRDTP